MSDVLIAAIARTCDETQREKLLSQCAGMETSRSTLFVRNSIGETPARSRMHLVPFGRSPITSGTYGTSVPGLGNTLALSAYLIDDGSHDLKGIGISSDAAYHYNLAIERGRGVVTYMASTENAAMI